MENFFVKNYKNIAKNENQILMFSKLLNKIELDLLQLNKKYEDLRKRMDEQHLENIRSDEILLEYYRNVSDMKCN